jgi:hypothetical protein
MSETINPNVTIETTQKFDPNFGAVLPRKYFCVYDKNKRLIAKLRDPNEAARYRTAGLGEYEIVEEDVENSLPNV